MPCCRAESWRGRLRDVVRAPLVPCGSQVSVTRPCVRTLRAPACLGSLVVGALHRRWAPKEDTQTCGYWEHGRRYALHERGSALRTQQAPDSMSEGRPGARVVVAAPRRATSAEFRARHPHKRPREAHIAHARCHGPTAHVPRPSPAPEAHTQAPKQRPMDPRCPASNTGDLPLGNRPRPHVNVCS